MKYDRLTDKNAKLCQVRDMPHEQYYYRLQELENKIEQGKLIELPCKVGDIVYEITPDNKHVDVGYVCIISIRNSGVVFGIHNGFDCYLSNYGKTWFIDKAEARLRELQK